MTSRDQVVQQALALTPEDRLYVADALEHSLSADGEFADPTIAAAWADEIDRRIAAFERDEMQASAGDVSLARIRRQLAEHRVRKAKP